MLKTIIKYLVVILALGLPFHGAISVFFPEWGRFWKEGVIFFLMSILLWEYWISLKQRVQELQITNYELRIKECLFDLRSKIHDLSSIFALLFLLWGGVLVLLSVDKSTALIAFRYLGFGFLVYLIFSGLVRFYSEEWRQQIIQKFSKYFIGSCVASVFFGTWAKFLGGYEVLKHFYSITISSWVPGQTLPLYHEAGGIIRMQGGSSGPIEFSHLLLVAIFLLSLRLDRSLQEDISDNKLRRFWASQNDLIYFGILLFGIYQSYSRAALLALLVGVVIWLLTEETLKRLRMGFIGILLMGFIGGGLHVFNTPELQEKLLERGGSSDHISRPIEAFKIGMAHPLLGNLGELGPAAREKNLQQNNDDKAPIAENVFVDYFAQLGVIGLILAIGFFVTVFWKAQKQWWPFVGGFFVVVNLATVFDMTPLAILCFIVFSFVQKKTKID